jgi:hypothetical protein
MKLWLDDQGPQERPAIACPQDWVQVFTAEDCLLELEKGGVTDLSVDCDLGAGGTGYSVACWLEMQAYIGNWAVVPENLDCHSANTVECPKVNAAFRNIAYLREMRGPRP